ncbi:PAS domain-containing protein, partial [Vibrio kyushuensis]|uniref:PAS domain-containing protein n=1 Tax=Vibrio kyushuensis TaxID=2910249 RepID=UPI003D0D1C3E
MAFWNKKKDTATQFVAHANDSLMDESSNSSLSHSQLMAALNGAQTALMMIDRDFKITYVNQQSMKLLKHHEALFQSQWPGFVADEEQLMGFCIDGFHTNPAHQRQLLSTAANLPYKTVIDVQGVKIELNVGAIIDDHGNYTGNTLEWQDVTAQQAKDNEVARLQASVDQAQTAMMMVDRDFLITYANAKTLTLLKTHEALFQTVWSNFKATEEHLIGYCIDGFHKDPSHQRQLLSNVNNLPYNTVIDVKGVKIELNVSAMIDSEGNYVGNTLEWDDVTEKFNRENEVTRLQASVDQAQTAMMMVDRDFLITYANAKTLTLLKTHEALFQTVWSNFKATEEHLIGYCIDGFHKDPSHQRQLLSNVNNLPYNTVIDVKGVKIELNVSAMIDSEGNYVGNTLEWD